MEQSVQLWTLVLLWTVELFWTPQGRPDSGRLACSGRVGGVKNLDLETFLVAQSVLETNQRSAIRMVNRGEGRAIDRTL